MDAVGFVVQSGNVRLTTSQKYIFNSVLSIFGKDIRFFATYADGKRPLLLDAIKEAELPCRKDKNGLPCHQKFNNGAIYSNNQDGFDEYLCWMNGENLKKFRKLPTKSLQMTIGVLERRKQLEIKLKWMQDAIPRHLTKMEVLRAKVV